MIGNVACIVFDAKNKTGLAATHQWQAENVKPGHVDDSTVMSDLALAVEDIDFEPAVIGTETGCPDDRADIRLVEIERQHR